MMRQSIFYFLMIFLAPFASAQSTIGLPEIVNFSKLNYKAGSQNRQLAQDKNGIIYIANNEGLLTYNGVNWKVYPLPNSSVVRSLEFGTDNKLYIGGQDEFGYFAPEADGILRFHSLKQLIPANERSFSDVWEISIINNLVFFQTSEKIFLLSGNTISIFKDPHWLFMGNVGNQVIAQSAEKGLLVFNNGLWVPYLQTNSNQLPKDYFATAITPIGKDSSLLATLKNGLYLLTNRTAQKFTSPLLEKLESKNISCIKMVNESQLAIGTNLDGCYIVDKGGNFVSSFGRKEGLQNNNILGVLLDKQNNIWLGLHNGIDFISYNNAIKHIYPTLLNEGAGYSSMAYQGRLYIGTSIGLFSAAINNQKDLSNIRSNFEAIGNTEGEAWNLSEVNGKLLLGHNDGAFLIENNAAKPLDKSTGYWNFAPFYSVIPSDIMVAGTYTGINFFNYTGNTFAKAPFQMNLESARFVVVAHNKIWFSHPYKGVYAVELKGGSPTYKKYSEKEGLLSNNNNYLFKIKNVLLLTTDNGVYEYNSINDKFQRSEYYNKYLPNVAIRYLKEDAEGNIWFVFEKKIGVLDVTGKTPQIIYFPELTNKFVAGFEHINPIDKNNILIGGEKGFYHINYEQYKKLKYDLQIKITSVAAINYNDSLLFGGYGNSINDAGNAPSNRVKFNNNFHSFRFEFAAPVYGQQNNIEYSYNLQGFDDNWSDYAKKTEKEYTNLAPGDYVFKVKARNNLGNESAVSSYSFTVLPPWYQTTWAYILYVVLFVVFNYLFFRYLRIKFKNQQRKHDLEQKRLQYLHQLEMDKAEKELVQLRNEKLEIELKNKNTELASTAMHLVQKSDVLQKVKEQMLKLKEQPGTAENTDDLKKILRTLSDEDKVNEQWQQFALHFDAVHSNFLQNLKNKYPGLTPNEQKLCAYLKINLSSKEIAQLMNISVRGVEISRYRLRKKLDIPSGTNLFNFLDTLE